MITLTTDASGVASDGSVILSAGQRYSLQWGDDFLDGPVAGTLTLKTVWGSGGSALPTIGTYDLSAVSSGILEFTPAHNATLLADIVGGGISKVIHIAIAPIK